MFKRFIHMLYRYGILKTDTTLDKIKYLLQYPAYPYSPKAMSSRITAITDTVYEHCQQLTEILSSDIGSVKIIFNRYNPPQTTTTNISAWCSKDNYMMEDIDKTIVQWLTLSEEVVRNYQVLSTDTSDPVNANNTQALAPHFRTITAIVDELHTLSMSM